MIYIIFRVTLLFQESYDSSSQPASPARKCTLKPMSPITKLVNFTFSPFSTPKRTNSHTNIAKATLSRNSSLAKTDPSGDLLKTGKELNIEQINTGGCGVDPSYSRGRNSKRSRSLIRRSSKKLNNQVPTISNADDCTIS